MTPTRLTWLALILKQCNLLYLEQTRSWGKGPCEICQAFVPKAQGFSNRRLDYLGGTKNHETFVNMINIDLVML